VRDLRMSRRKPKHLSELGATTPRFIEPMYARPVQHLPEGKEWFYEVNSTATVAWPAETRAA
jgi:hypothetical protein